MAATSGTVLSYSYDQRKVIEHAMRRAGKSSVDLSGEWITIAQDLLFTTLSEWINAQKPIWTRKSLLLGAQVGLADVATPIGTNEVEHTYWRQLSPYRGAATTSAGADASALFGGQPNADIVIVGPNAAVIVNFAGATEVDTIGVLLGGGATLTAALAVETSPDGVTWTLSQNLPSTTFTPGVWSYFDLAPSATAQFVRLRLPAGNWALNQLNFGLASSSTTELGQLNRDDYFNLPDLFFRSDRPNSCYVDKPLGSPVIKIWPTLNIGAFYNGCVTALAWRYIQDPGAMTNGIEVQPRFLEALQWRLAQKLIYELPDDSQGSQQNYFTLMAKQQRITNIETNAKAAEALAWAEEKTGGPVRIAPNISGYTR
jgi:hypothetical protein